MERGGAGAKVSSEGAKSHKFSRAEERLKRHVHVHVAFALLGSDERDHCVRKGARASNRLLCLRSLRVGVDRVQRAPERLNCAIEGQAVIVGGRLLNGDDEVTHKERELVKERAQFGHGMEDNEFDLERKCPYVSA